MKNNDSEIKSASLRDFINDELLNIPIMKWGYFFPCWIGIWRYIEHTWPNSLGEVNARYETEPIFEGYAAEWFCGILGNNEQLSNEVEAIMYPITDNIAPAAVERGFVKDLTEIRAIDNKALNRLVLLIEQEVAHGFKNGYLSSALK